MNNLNSDYLSVFDTQPIAACIDWDPELRLLAVGTKGGALRVFGAPGVELLGQHEGGEELTVLRYSLQPCILETIGVILFLNLCLARLHPGFFLFPGKTLYTKHQVCTDFCA